MIFGLVICSTCFGHVYAHHQKLATILLIRHVACNSWFMVARRSGAGQQAMRTRWGKLLDWHIYSKIHSPNLNHKVQSACFVSSSETFWVYFMFQNSSAPVDIKLTSLISVEQKIAHVWFNHFYKVRFSFFLISNLRCFAGQLPPFGHAPARYSSVCLLINPYPTAFPYGNGMVLHFYQQQESSTTKTVHKVINKRLKTYV